MEHKTLASCLAKIPNRFELVTVGWRRAHQLIDGGAPFVARQGEKAEAQALREIAAGAFDFDTRDNQWRPVMEPIFEPVAVPQEEEIPRDEDRDDDLPE
jgi:DNA-directed RNA polymerase subunit omega